jgi:hypothetical protein
MTDIICRCGEPWDSTGGLHHSHSDLTWWQYEQLVRGLGCPSCEGEFAQTPEADDAWRRSVQFLANGSCKGGQPYPGFPLSVAPHWHRAYRGENDEPTYKEAATTPELAPLAGFDGDLVMFPSWLRDHHDQDILWFAMPSDHFVGGPAMQDGADRVREVNWGVVEKVLVNHPYIEIDRAGRPWVGLARYASGRLEVFTTPTPECPGGKAVATVIDEFLTAVYNDPCLDDEAMSARESELREAAINEWMEDAEEEIAAAWGLGAWGRDTDRVAVVLYRQPEGGGPSIAERFFADYPTSGSSWDGKDPDVDKLIENYFDEACPRGPLGWIFVETPEPEIWMVIPKIPGISDLKFLPGYVVQSTGSISWVWRMPDSQVKWTRFGNLEETRWDLLPVAARRAINEALADDADDADTDDAPPEAFR